MSIYSDNRKPYFYIIQHKETSIKYAGAKWARDANSNNFMTEAGYKTSYNTIHKLIAKESLNAFDIIEIIELEELQIPFGCQTIDEYESWFLETNKCCTAESWYNEVPPWWAPYGSDSFYKNMVNKYGVKYPGQIESHAKKVKATCNIKHGADSYFESNEAKVKLLNYIHEFDESATNVWQLDFIKDKNKETCMANHGVEYPAQSKVIFSKMTKSLLENHGVDSPMKSPALRELHKNACNVSLGVDSPMQSKKVVAKYKSNFKEKWGVGYPSQVKFYCGECNKTGTGISHITRYHKNHKNVTVFLVNDVPIEYTKHLS